MRGFEPDEQVNMIPHATDTLRSPAQTADGTADVIVKARPQFQCDPWFAVFCREDDMIEEIGVRRGHGGNGWHPFRGACFMDLSSGGIASLNHRLQAEKPPA